MLPSNLDNIKSPFIPKLRSTGHRAAVKGCDDESLTNSDPLTSSQPADALYICFTLNDLFKLFFSFNGEHIFVGT